MATLTWVRMLSVIAGTGIMIAAEDIRIPLLTDTLAGPEAGAFVAGSRDPASDPEPVRSALPEPATIMLFGTVAWFVGARLRRSGRERATAALRQLPASGEQSDNGRAMRSISLHDPANDTDRPAD